MTPCIISHSGRITYKTVDGERHTAYRVVYCEFNKVSIESIKGKVVRHKCDNPACLNGEHLLLGTQLDNIQDKVDRNRQAKGSNNAKAKLTEALVLEIRSKTRSTLKELSQEYNMSLNALSCIINRKTWKHI